MSNYILPVGLSLLVGGLTAGYYLINNTKKPVLVLDKDKFNKFKLVEKKILSHNSALYRFELPHKEAILGLPIGQHISIMLEVDGKQVLRSYTPTSTDSCKGYFELVIKTYDAGIISKHIASLNIGDTIDVRGPKGAFKYQPNMVDSFTMIAGGTGITPMYQVMQAILSNPEDKTKLSLIYANVSQDDILLYEEIESLKSKHPEQLKVHYILNNPPETWEGSQGFVTSELIQEQAFKPDPRHKVLLCGPPPMIKAMGQYCSQLQYGDVRALSKIDDAVFKF